MKTVHRIEKRKISEKIVDEIKRLIEDGVFGPDHKLPTEKELSEMFGVGRSSVREALSMLAAAEIIETRQGEGTFVRKVELRDYIPPLALSMVTKKEQALHLLETRKIVELGTVELAALRSDESDLLRMRKALVDLEMQLKMGEIGMNADFNFHQAIALASKNPVLIQVMENLSQVMMQSIEFTLRQNTGRLAERRKKVVAEHQAILSCIEKRDAPGAKQAMEVHLENVRQKLLAMEA